jgi:hypothetical protein
VLLFIVVKPAIEDMDDVRIWRILFADGLECDEFRFSIDRVIGHFKREHLKSQISGKITNLLCVFVNRLDLLVENEMERYLENISILAMPKWFLPFNVITRRNGTKWDLQVIPKSETRQIIETKFGNTLC